MSRRRILAHQPSAGAATPWIAWLILALVVVAVAVIRLRLADAPIERDEGEYAYAGQLILEGVPPYALAYNMKFPGTYYAYSLLLALFGQTAWGVHVGLLAITASSTVLLFLIGRRLIGELGGTTAAVLFAVLSLDQGVLGAYAHATHFIVLPMLAGVLVALHAVSSSRRSLWLVSGSLFGLAGLMNQMGAWFVPFGLALAVWAKSPRAAGASGGSTVARAGLFVGGAGLPVIVASVVLAAQGEFARALFWTIEYARAYVSETPWSVAGEMLSLSWPDVTHATLAFWILAAAGAAAIALGRWPAPARLCAIGLLVSGAFAISPGFYFRNHYFVLLLPAVALFGGAAVAALDRWLGARSVGRGIARGIALLVPGVLIGSYIVQERNYLFFESGPELTRSTYGANPFTEAGEIAHYLEGHTDKDDRVAVLGSEPEIYFHAHRKSATGYIYMYSLLEPQPYAAQMRQEMVDEIQAARPKYLVAVWVRNSWINSIVADQGILEWSKRYAQQCYDLVGIADIDSSGTTMVWEPEVATYHPHSQDLIYTLKRKTDAPCRVALAR